MFPRHMPPGRRVSLLHPLSSDLRTKPVPGRGYEFCPVEMGTWEQGERVVQLASLDHYDSVGKRATVSTPGPSPPPQGLSSSWAGSRHPSRSRFVYRTSSRGWLFGSW